jgi:DNA-binding LytR/AlgR family response regulator
MRLKTVIVDDEPIARKGMKSLIDKVDFLEHIDSAKDIDQLLQLLNAHEVDLILLDIEMPGMSGIDFMKTYQGDMQLAIFVTAYHQFAVDSYNLHAVDYLLKPVSFERFSDAMNRAKTIAEARANNQHPAQPFFIRHEGKFVKIEPKNVLVIASMQNYLKIHSADESIMIRSTLKEFQRQLGSMQFLMVHKSYIINVDEVESISASHLTVKGFGQIPIGRKFKDDVLARLLNR